MFPVFFLAHLQCEYYQTQDQRKIIKQMTTSSAWHRALRQTAGTSGTVFFFEN